MIVERLLEKVCGKPISMQLRGAFTEIHPRVHVQWDHSARDRLIPRAYDRDVLPWPDLADVTPFLQPYESGGFAAVGFRSTATSMVYLVDRVFSKTRGSEQLALRDYLLDSKPAREHDSPELIAYGHELRVWQLNGQQCVGHTGTQTGYSGMAFHCSESDVSFAVFANLSTINQASIAREILSEATRLKDQPNL